MKSNIFKSGLLKSGLVASVLLAASAALHAQAVVDLTATGGATYGTTLPDGQFVPMWGYTCGTTVTGATCVATNPNAGTGWSPVLITVPVAASGATSLTVNLTNNLPGGVPTSLTIVGQLGGGLGAAPTRTPSPAHAPQGATWPANGPADSSACQSGGDPAGTGTFCPPVQGDRVQSFGTEVATTGMAALTWTNLRPGTYLIESGTHPSIQGPMGLFGMLVVTAAPGTSAGCAYPGATAGSCAVSYNADIPLLLSEIDPVQNAAVAAAVATTGFSESKVWSGDFGACGNPLDASGNPTPTYQTCYPPAVNYDPRYYLVNGAAFDRVNQARSLVTSGATTTSTGTVLVRFVNAGLRMHVPVIVGAQTTDNNSGAPAVVSGVSLIAEDGNLLPGVAATATRLSNPRTQSSVFLPAGKTYDVMINAPATGTNALAVFDRQLSLSTNNVRDGGMQAFISANGGGIAPVAASAAANADTYYVVPGVTLTVSEQGKGVIANDVGVYGVQLDAANAATGGTVTLNSNGTFTFVPSSASGSFGYCGNGATSGALCATVTLAACTGTCLGGAPTANNDAYTSTFATRLQVAPPGG